MLCEFTLPSNPEIKVRLREATVAEAIDFSSIHPECEEEATSLFLDKVQEKGELHSNPREWTGEDRRYALFMYFLNTTTYSNIPLTYECSICGNVHTKDIELSTILDEYTPIQGPPYREFPLDGHNVIIRPLTGQDLEDIEKYRYDLHLTQNSFEELRITAQKQKKVLSPDTIKRFETEIRAKQVRLAMLQVLCRIDIPHLDPEGTPRTRRPKVEASVKAMGAEQFKEFMERVDNAMIDMRHGLRTTYIDGEIVLEIPDVRCDEEPELPGVLLRYPFRFASVIPTL